jgi:cyclic-di-GMP-binding protein
MVDLIGKLRAITKPLKGNMLDTGWLDELPKADYLTSQEIVLGRLWAFASDENPLDRQALSVLFAIDERCREGVAAVTKQYVGTPSLTFEADERIWQFVHNYYQALDKAYQAFLDRHTSNPAQSQLTDAIPQLILNSLDSQRCVAKWRYLRYQSMAEGGWLKLHRLYQLAEQTGCTVMPLRRFPDQPETTVMSCYFQALMLDTLNHTSMMKAEIEMLAGWLTHWSGALVLEASYSEAHHLFFVNLEEDRGGRRIRHSRPTKSYRFWDTDKLVQQVDRLRGYLKQGRLPEELHLAPNVGFSDCQLLVEHMLVEWSRTIYLRQRRSDEREKTMKVAQVVNGILNCCQHVKNVVYNRGRETQYDELNVSHLPDDGFHEVKAQVGEIVLPGINSEQWDIEDESKYGFGAIVNAELNFWLRPGKLIVLDYEMYPEMPVVGVVRSVKQRPGYKCHVGIEVLCHTPAYVRMRSIYQEEPSHEFLPTDVFLASAMTVEGTEPFPALYLPKDEERDIPSTLLLPKVEFITGGVFELRTDKHHCQARLGRVLEQKDDWVRVEVQFPDGGKSLD